MITDEMYWAVVVVTGRPTEPLKAIGPLASKREAEGYASFIDKECHVINIAPKNQYGAPVEYPFLTEAEVEGE